MIARAASDDLSQNPAGAFALLQWRAHQRAGQGIHVLMPYNDALRDVAPWFMQLWAESLGKVDVDGVNVGPTPLASLGATDQHSQLQLYMEGPVDKTVTFLRDRSAPAALRIPAPPASLAELAWLGGHELGELLDAECRATAAALAKAGRPSMTLSVGKVDAHNLGALLMCLMHATVYAGALYRVNALDQPGVELGKRIARAAITEAPGAGTPQTRWEA
jgi:glucose-6-phosphate isomerase